VRVRKPPIEANRIGSAVHGAPTPPLFLLDLESSLAVLFVFGDLRPLVDKPYLCC
jgi:hypothetical protein